MMTEVPQFRKVGCADWYDGYADHEDGGGPYEERVLYTAPAEAGDALEAIEAMDTGGWALTRHRPSSYLTDAANKRGAWSVQRTEAPYCDKDDNRVWQGPSPIEALRTGRKAVWSEA